MRNVVFKQLFVKLAHHKNDDNISASLNEHLPLRVQASSKEYL